MLTCPHFKKCAIFLIPIYICPFTSPSICITPSISPTPPISPSQSLLLIPRSIQLIIGSKCPSTPLKKSSPSLFHLILNWFGIMHCAKSVQIRSFFCSVFSRIQSKYGKIWIRKNSVFGHFLLSDYLPTKSSPAVKHFWNPEKIKSLTKGVCYVALQVVIVSPCISVHQANPSPRQIICAPKAEHLPKLLPSIHNKSNRSLYLLPQFWTLDG